MLANDSNLFTFNPIIIYSLLGLYGIVSIVVLAYVHKKFNFADKTLKKLASEWESAETRHAGFVGKAQEQISKLAVPAAVSAPAERNTIGFDMRNQVVSMGRKGFSAMEIAKACNMPEGEVEVLLGMARLQR